MKVAAILGERQAGLVDAPDPTRLSMSVRISSAKDYASLVLGTITLTNSPD